MNTIQWTTEDAARVTTFVSGLQALVRDSGRDAQPIVLGLIEAVASLMLEDIQHHPERLTGYAGALKQMIDHVMPTPIAVRDGETTH